MALKLGKIREVNGNVVKNVDTVRVDIFKDKKNKFYGVPIYTIDFAKRIMPNKAAVSEKDKVGIIKDWIEMNDNYEFCFSLYKDDLIKVQKKDMSEAVLCYYYMFNTSSVSISAKKHDNRFDNLNDNEIKFKYIIKGKNVIVEGLGIQNLKVFEKMQIDSIGNIKKVESRKREQMHSVIN